MEKENTIRKNSEKLNIFIVTVTTHALGGYLCISIAYAEACQMLHLS